MRVSLQVVLLGAATVVAAMSGAIALWPLYNEAAHSSEEAASIFASEVAAKVAVNVQSYLAQPVFFASSVARATRLGALTNNQSIAAWLCDWVSKSEEDMLFIYYFDDASGFIAGRANTLNLSIRPKPLHTILAFYNATLGVADYWYFPDGDVNMAATPINQTHPTTFNHTIRPYATTFREATNASTTANRDPLRWSSPFVDFSEQFADVGIGGPLARSDGTGGVGPVYGILGVFYRTIAIKEYFSQLTVGKTGRALLVDATTDTYLGGTTSADSVVTVGSKVELATPDQLEDGVSRKALDGIGSRLSACSDTCAVTIGGGFDALFVSVTAIKDEFGLNLRVVVAVPAEDYLDPIRKSLLVGVGAAAGAICGILIMSGFLLHFLLYPLRRLERRLYESSTLREHDLPSDEAPSCLSEIFTIETAYMELVAELKKVRSYLPQSVLRQLDQGPSEASVKENEASHVTSPDAMGIVPPPQERGTSLAFADMQPQPQHRFSTSGDGSCDVVLPDRLDEELTASNNARVNVSISAASTEETDERNATAASAAPPPPVPAQQPIITSPLSRKPPLHLEGVLHARRVAVVMANLCGFHKAQQLMRPVELQRMHAAVAQRILTVVNQYHGVLDFFHGDRFTASFNASVACNAPSERCCETILALTQQLPALEQRGFTGIRFGAATDMALCGVFGPGSMKRYSIVGAVVNHAFALMQQSKLEGVLNLISHATYDAARSDFVAQHVNFVMLPQAASGALISTLLGRSSNPSPTSVLNSQPGSPVSAAPPLRVPLDVVQTINDAFCAFAAGDIKRVRLLHAKVPREHGAALARSLRTIEAMQSAVAAY